MTSWFDETFSGQTDQTQCGNTKNSFPLKKFRQINYLVISLVKQLKPLLSQNFCQKCVRVNFCNIHSTLRSLRNFCITIFWKNSVKTTVKSFTVKLISRNNPQVIQKFRKLHTVHTVYSQLWTYWKFTLNIFSQKFREFNCFIAKLHHHKVFSRKFSQVRVNLVFFHIMYCMNFVKQPFCYSC